MINIEDFQLTDEKIREAYDKLDKYTASGMDYYRIATNAATDKAIIETLMWGMADCQEHHHTFVHARFQCEECVESLKELVKK